MKKKTVVFQQKEIDHQTGAINKETKVYRVDREPEYVKLYIKDICSLLNLKKNAHEVLYQCLQYLDYEGDITLLAYKRKKIANAIGVTDQTVKNQLTLLCNSGVLLKRSNMVYAVNPNLFARGDWVNINKMRDDFQLLISYTKNKRIIKGKSVDKQPDFKSEDSMLKNIN